MMVNRTKRVTDSLCRMDICPKEKVVMMTTTMER